MINNKKILSVITARANSSYVGKNYKELHGKPLFMWSVEQSLKSKYIDLTVVSSNCPFVREIISDNIDLLILKDFIFVLRPDELATVISKNEDALIHAYYYCKYKLNFCADLIVNLQPTSPIREKQLIDNCIEYKQQQKADSLCTVSAHTPFFIKKNQGKLEWTYDYKNRPMRQELSDDDMFYHDDGCVYVMDASMLLETKCRLGNDICVFHNSPVASLQIDTPLDFNIIESIMNQNEQR